MWSPLAVSWFTALSGHAILAISASGIAPELNRSQLYAICHGGQSGKVIDLLARRCLSLGHPSVASGACAVEQISSSKWQCGKPQASMKAAFGSFQLSLQLVDTESEKKNSSMATARNWESQSYGREGGEEKGKGGEWDGLYCVLTFPVHTLCYQAGCSQHFLHMTQPSWWLKMAHSFSGWGVGRGGRKGRGWRGKKEDVDWILCTFFLYPHTVLLGRLYVVSTYFA